MMYAVRLLSVLIFSVVLFAQRGHRDPTPQDRDASPDRAVLVPRVDMVQAVRDSQELIALSQSVGADVQASGGNTIPKDLRDRLKKIEKLSKKVRSDLLLD